MYIRRIINNKCSFSKFNSFNALSPLDGRYSNTLKNTVSDYFSEAALMKYRIKVESVWLIHLIQNNIIHTNNKTNNLQDLRVTLENLYLNFNDQSAARIKQIESITNHDLKSVEYFIKQNIPESFVQYKEYIHFCCTSEDINNLAYALMLKQFSSKAFIPKMENIVEDLLHKAQKWSNHKMLSRTHGQPATPSTMGKQYANFAHRLGKQVNNLKKIQISGKFNGAVGNYNAHYFAYPNVDWMVKCQQFVENTLGLNYNRYTTQIQPHDSLARYMGQVGLFNTISIGLCRDTWEYISKSYLTQKIKAGEVGSSTMPHKVNPIDFQNCQGNLGVSNSIIDHFRNKLPISRLQRDLSDSTVLRNQGTIFGYSMIGYQSLRKGLEKIQSNQIFMQKDLDNHYEVVTQAIQTQLRKIGYPEPYELLKKLSRDTAFTSQSLHLLVLELEKNLPAIQKDSIEKIKNLTPLNYIGQARLLAEKCRENTSR